ncbi:MAG: hypothetical protein R3F24_07625 [Gammaproteobacteria bacterium]
MIVLLLTGEDLAGIDVLPARVVIIRPELCTYASTASISAGLSTSLNEGIVPPTGPPPMVSVFSMPFKGCWSACPLASRGGAG